MDLENNFFVSKNLRINGATHHLKGIKRISFTFKRENEENFNFYVAANKIQFMDNFDANNTQLIYRGSNLLIEKDLISRPSPIWLEIKRYKDESENFGIKILDHFNNVTIKVDEFSIVIASRTFERFRTVLKIELLAPNEFFKDARGVLVDGCKRSSVKKMHHLTHKTIRESHVDESKNESLKYWMKQTLVDKPNTDQDQNVKFGGVLDNKVIDNAAQHEVQKVDQPVVPEVSKNKIHVKNGPMGH